VSGEPPVVGLGVVSIDHVGVLVDDLDAAMWFYTEVLGLTERSDRPELRLRGAWLDVGDGQLHVFEGRAPHDAGQHVAFRVADIDVVVERLSARGIEHACFPKGEPPRQVIVHDPAGNRVELTVR
jgi:catechol 2,3-dioxygenase-like lactoylglutathione lyase family enzyme